MSRQNDKLDELRPLLDSLGAERGCAVRCSFGRPGPAEVACARRFEGASTAYDIVLPDYLDDAPAEVLAGVAEACVARVEGVDGWHLPSAAEAWLAQPAFALRRRGQWMARCGIGAEPEWVAESAASLRAVGLDVGDALVREWPSPSLRIGVSRLMRVALVPSMAGRLPLSQGARDALVWAAACRASAGWPGTSSGAYARERGLPGYGAHREELERAGLVM